MMTDNTQIIHSIIKESIFNGLKNACDKTKEYTQEESVIIPAEYLLTVNIADDLNTNLRNMGFKTILEFNTADLSDLNYDEMGGSLFNLVLNDANQTSRSGRVDIALIHSIQKAFTCIELKRLNPSKSQIIEDIKRLSELVNKSSNTGDTKMLYTYLSFIYGETGHFQNHFDLEKKSFEKYKKVLDEISKEFLTNSNSDKSFYPFDFDLLLKTVSHQNLENINTDEVIDTSHQYIGVIIKLKKYKNDIKIDN